MARRQWLVGIAADRHGHADVALGDFELGVDERLPLSRKNRLGSPDHRADVAFALSIDGIFFVEQRALRSGHLSRRGGALLRGVADAVQDLGPRRSDLLLR